MEVKDTKRLNKLSLGSVRLRHYWPNATWTFKHRTPLLCRR